MQPDRIEAAIAAIERQRDQLGERVAEIALAALREQRTAVETADMPQRDTRRKLVTILFAKFEGLTRQAEAAATANVLYLVNMLWRRFDKIIAEHGGRVDSHVGDVVMGVFGVPSAAEDDAERALRAALALRAAVSNFLHELRQQAALDAVLQPELDGVPMFSLSMQIGINSGPVLLGEVGSGGEYTALGDTVNVASRLQQEAPPGGILVTDATYRLVADIFETEEVQPLTLRGKPRPIPVRMLLGLKTRLFFASSRGVEGIETRMVGREPELERLRLAVATARDQRVVQHLLVIGDAGVGKSRLMMEVVDELQQDDAICLLRGRTEPRWQQTPLALMRDVIMRSSDVLDGDATAVVQTRLDAAMAALLGLHTTEARLRGRQLARAVGLDLSGGGAQFGDAGLRREQSFAHLITFLRDVARRHPLTLLVLEDLHWADESSLAFLARLREALVDVPLMVVATTRPVLQETRPHWGADPLVLLPLNAAESQALVVDILRRVDNLPASLTQLIVETAEGNPFYLEELVKVLIEDGVIVVREDTWHVVLSQVAQLRVPASLTGVLQARLDRLSATERLTLQRAAVVGRDFWQSAVLQLSETDIRPVDPRRVRDALQTLQKRELIFRLPASTMSDEAAYTFKHAILREVVYESVLLRERPLYHRVVGDWLTARSSERLVEMAAVIAAHYEQAGELQQAAVLYETAGMRAMEMHEPAEAVNHFRKVLELMASRPLPLVGLLDVQERLARMLLIQARLLDAGQMLLILQATAETEGDLSAQARAWLALAGLYALQEAWEPLLAAAQHAERLSRLLASETQLVDALCWQGQARLALGAPEQAFEALLTARATAVRLDLESALGRCLLQLGRIHAATGDAAAARAVHDELWQLARHHVQAGHVSPAAAEVADALGMACLALKAPEEAVTVVATAVTGCEALGDVALEARLRATLARLYTAVGQHDAAVAAWQASIAASESLGRLLEAFDARLSLAALLIEQGDVAYGSAVVEPVRRFARETGQLREWARRVDLAIV